MYFAHDTLEHEKSEEDFKMDDHSVTSSLTSDDDFSDYVDEKAPQPNHETPKPVKAAVEQAKESKSSYRNVLASGGRAAVARKVTANLNEDDQIIFNMKQEGSTDRQIAIFLRDSGRINYNQKTIGTRWKRIRLALAKAKDEALDRGEASWNDNDDAALATAVERAECTVNRLKQQAEDSKWDIVARELCTIQGAQLFSQRACRERFEVLGRAATADYILQLAGDVDNEYEAAAGTPSNDVVSDDQDSGATKAVSTGGGGQPLFVRDPIDDDEPVTPTPAVAPRGLPPMALNLSIDHTSAERLHPLTEGLHPSTETPHRAARMANDKRRRSRAITDITRLSDRANQAMTAEENKRLGCKELAGLKLKRLDQMNRTEMRAELQARGLRRDGIKSNMLATLEAARAGAANLPASPLPANAEPLRALLKRKAVSSIPGRRRLAKKPKVQPKPVMVEDADDEGEV